MKKHLALVLALVMVLGSFSFVSAAPEFADVKDTTFEEAVTSLELLNVLKGYPDGTFKPANTITRAEFAAVAVRVSGLEQAAISAKGLPTGFSDVYTQHWASGYIGTAAKLGIVNGIGGGLFAPESPVKYEEAITMIVRALGYEPAAQAKGGYPFGYLIVANEIDLLDGALGTQGTWATRGFVAQITFNALEIEMMIQSGYGTDSRFVVSGTDGTDEKYLIDQMGFKSVEGRVTDYDADDKEIEIEVVEENGVELSRSKNETYDVMDTFDFYKNHGFTVKAWLDGDKVLLTKILDNVMFDAVEFDEGDEDLGLVTADKDYDLAKDEDKDIMTQFIIGDGKAFAYNKGDFNVDYAKVVMDGSKVVWAEGFVFDEFMFVEEVDDMVLVDLNDDEVDVEDYLIVKDGMTIEAKDIKEGDVVFLFNDDYRDYDGFAVVANMAEEGVVTKAYAIAGNTAKNAFKLDGSTYDLSLLGAKYVDGDELKDVDAKALEAYEDEEEEITIFLDYYGRVVVMTGEMGATSTLGAILTEDANVYSGRSGPTIAWDLVNELGAKVKFDEVNNDRDDYLTPVGDIVADIWQVVEYTLDEDGDLDEDIAVLNLQAAVNNGKLEFDDRYVSGQKLESNTVVFLVDDVDDDEVDEVFLWSDAEDYFGEATRYDVYAEDGVATYLVVYDSDAAGDFEDEAGIVVDIRKVSSSKSEYTINIEGKEYSIDVDTNADVKIGSIVEFRINEDMDDIKDLELAPVERGIVKDIQVGAKTFKIGNQTQTYELTRNAVIYHVEDDDVIALRDLEKLGAVSVNAYRDEGSPRFISYLVIGEAQGTPVDPDLDLTALNAAKANAAAFDEEDYTADSWADLQDALDLPETTQAQVGAKVDAINDAIDALEPVLETDEIAGTFVDGLFGPHVRFDMPAGETEIDSATLNGVALDPVIFEYAVDLGEGVVNINAEGDVIKVVIDGVEYEVIY